MPHKKRPGTMIKSLCKMAPNKSDLFLFLGTGFLCYGAFLIWPPAAYITAGLIFGCIGVAQARVEAPASPEEATD